MDFVELTVLILKSIANLVGNWGLAIILLTILIRLALWHSNVSQQRSMRAMQQLQPKLRIIQERYKSDPQKMQQKLAEFYKEHKFNPMGGCLPMLIQLPIFILLYTAFMSPQFIQLAGKTDFLFINRLDATMQGTAGLSYDGKFQANPTDKFTSTKDAKVYLKDGKILEKVRIINPAKAVIVQGDIVAGQDMDLKFPLDNLNEKFSVLDSVEKAEIDVTDANTRETEKITFTRNGDNLVASIPTVAVKSTLHYDVLFLIILFAVTIWLSQKVMMAQNKNQPQDPTQQAIQKSMGTFMPFFITAMFLFIPIPAGALLYLVTSNVFQIFQTLIINKQLDKEDEEKKNKNAVKDAKSKVQAEGKVIEVNEIKDVKEEGEGEK